MIVFEKKSNVANKLLGAQIIRNFFRAYVLAIICIE